jgi:dTDP-D-glucose 4,6-dehydratase
MNELKKQITDYVAGFANHDIRTALHVSKIGNKYVSLVNLYNPSKTIRMTLDEFASEYM